MIMTSSQITRYSLVIGKKKCLNNVLVKSLFKQKGKITYISLFLESFLYTQGIYVWCGEDHQ